MTVNEELSTITHPNIETVNQYIALEEEKKKLKDALKKVSELQESLYDTVLETVQEYGNQNLTIKTRRSYGDWPIDILTKEEELKELKAQAKRVGNVPYEVKEYLSFVSDPEEGD